jgi:hypothetical protein
VSVRLGVRLKVRDKVGVSVKGWVEAKGVAEARVGVGVDVKCVGVEVGVKYTVTVGTGVFNPPITVAMNCVATGVPVTWSCIASSTRPRPTAGMTSPRASVP